MKAISKNGKREGERENVKVIENTSNRLSIASLFTLRQSTFVCEIFRLRKATTGKKEKREKELASCEMEEGRERGERERNDLREEREKAERSERTLSLNGWGDIAGKK